MTTNKINYRVYINFDFHLNERLIHFLYMPILGTKALDIYRYLVNMNAYQASIGPIIKLDFPSMLMCLSMNEMEFSEILKTLEAMHLIESYKDINKNDLIIFHIFEPLKWEQFGQNPKYMNLLKQKLGEIEFEKLKYVFNDNNPTVGLVNISKTFDNIYKATELFRINFDYFYDFLFKLSKQMVTIDEQIKVILNNSYEKYNFQYGELCAILQESLYKKENCFKIDELLLIKNIKSKIDQRNLKHFNLQLKINRNNKIFLQGSKIEEFKYVIDDYKTMNSEQYLACVQKHALSADDIILIKNLRKEYSLPDFVINILIDYCIFKNNGRIEPRYLQKIALTVNRLNLNNVNAIITHLQIANSNNKLIATSTKLDW